MVAHETHNISPLTASRTIWKEVYRTKEHLREGSAPTTAHVAAHLAILREAAESGQAASIWSEQLQLIKDFATKHKVPLPIEVDSDALSSYDYLINIKGLSSGEAADLVSEE